MHAFAAMNANLLDDAPAWAADFAHLQKHLRLCQFLLGHLDRLPFALRLINVAHPGQLRRAKVLQRDLGGLILGKPGICLVPLFRFVSSLFTGKLIHTGCRQLRCLDGNLGSGERIIHQRQKLPFFDAVALLQALKLPGLAANVGRDDLLCRWLLPFRDLCADHQDDAVLAARHLDDGG